MFLLRLLKSLRSENQSESTIENWNSPFSWAIMVFKSNRVKNTFYPNFSHADFNPGSAVPPSAL